MVAHGGAGLFVDHKKGEIPELKALLRDSAVSKDPKQKRLVMERVVGYMTLGIDMSGLFSEMTMATATHDLVQKKMCYLYLSNYASLQPDLALLVINTLQKDACDEDPMVRGLALRCLCSLHVDDLLDYIISPVMKGLDDKSPYVRKSAVMCILKIKELSKDAVKERRLVERTFELVQDRDQQVVANAIHVLMALQGEMGMQMLLSHSIVIGLLNRLKELNEWSQCLILHVVSHYKPESDERMFEIMNCLDERLRHNNSAVVLAAVRVFLRVTIDSGAMHYQVLERVRAPLITLMTGGSPETAYVLLKHIMVLAQRAPGVFEDEYVSFFVRFSDPIQVMELKVRVLTIVASPANCAAIIKELAAVVGPYNSQLSRLATRAIGQIAIKVPAAVPTVVSHLERFMRRGSTVVCEQSLIVSVNMARRYPHESLALVQHLVRASETVQSSEARRALVWMLGQFGGHVQEAPYILEEMVDEWDDIEDAGVKNDLLTACVKLAFKKPAEVQPILGRLLKIAVDDASNVDLHDRALYYYRLLQAGVEEARQVVEEGEREAVVHNFADEDSMQHRDALFEDFGTLSVIYGQPAVNWLQKEQLDEWHTVTDPAVGVDGVNSNPPPPPAAPTPSQQPPQLSSGGGGSGGGGGGGGGSGGGGSGGGGGGDLLDLSEYGFVVPTPIALDPNASITPEMYQECWLALQDGHTSKYAFPMTPGHGEIEACLGRSGIKVMATGSAGPGARKFFLYGMASGSQDLCMCEAVLDEGTAVLTCKYKTTEPAHATRLALTFRGALSEMGIQ